MNASRVRASSITSKMSVIPKSAVNPAMIDIGSM
jgi:hypothetical protein